MISKHVSVHEKLQISVAGKSGNFIYWTEGNTVIPLLSQPVWYKPQPVF